MNDFDIDFPDENPFLTRGKVQNSPLKRPVNSQLDKNSFSSKRIQNPKQNDQIEENEYNNNVLNTQNISEDSNQLQKPKIHSENDSFDNAQEENIDIDKKNLQKQNYHVSDITELKLEQIANDKNYPSTNSISVSSKTTTQSPPSEQEQSTQVLSPTRISQKISKSPVIKASLKGEYNLDDLPGAYPPGTSMTLDQQEEEITPRILNLSLPERIACIDTEKDKDPEGGLAKEVAINSFVSFVGENLVKDIESKSWKTKLRGLNALQEKLESFDDLDQFAEPLIRGLEKYVTWNQPTVVITLMTIDLIRHIIVKAENISKAALVPVFPFLVEKLGFKKYQPAEDLLHIIAQAICPSFVLQQSFQVLNLAKVKSSKNLPKMIENLVDICKEFGPGSICATDIIPFLKPLLLHLNNTVKQSASEIACYIYKTTGDAFMTILNDPASPLPDNIFKRLTEQFANAKYLPNPQKVYYRQKPSNDSSVSKALLEKVKEMTEKEEAKPRQKLIKQITQEAIDEGLKAKKIVDQRGFLENVDHAIQALNNKISSSDLEPIFEVLKTYADTDNKNLTVRSLIVMQQIAQAADKGVGKYASMIAQSCVMSWFDGRPNVRSQATSTIDTFCQSSSPQPFIRAFVNISKAMNSQSALEISTWIKMHLNEISNSDFERLSPFIVSCLVDKDGKVRNTAMELGKKLQEVCPDSFIKAISNLPKDIERELKTRLEKEQIYSSNFQSTSTGIAPKKDENDKKKPIQQNTPVKNRAKIFSDTGETKDKEPLKFQSQPTQAKKIKRLRAVPQNCGIGILTDRSLLQTLIEKAKGDAQTLLPPTVFQKLFANSFSDQSLALADIKDMKSSDFLSVCYISDIIIRWLAARLFDKNTKISIEGLNLLIDLYCDENPITVQEMDIIVPLILWCTENKPTLIDVSLDLLQVIHSYSDPSEYSAILHSCLELNIENSNTLAILFSELQYSVTDDGENGQYFIDCLPYISHNSINLAAAAGGYLVMLVNHMTAEEFQEVLSGMTPEQKDSVSTIIPIESVNSLDFENFSSMNSLEKLKSLRALQEQISSNPILIEGMVKTILEQIMKEILIAETDWSLIKSVMFAIHSLLLNFDIDTATLQKTVISVASFSNRYQRRLILFEGLTQMINSVIFKLVEKLSPISFFSALLDGMDNDKYQTLSADSFYCKAWVTCCHQLLQNSTKADLVKVSDFATSKMSRYRIDDIRVRLLNAVQAIATGKKTVDFQPPEKPKFVVNNDRKPEQFGSTQPIAHPKSEKSPRSPKSPKSPKKSERKSQNIGINSELDQNSDISLKGVGLAEGPKLGQSPKHNNAKISPVDTPKSPEKSPSKHLTHSKYVSSRSPGKSPEKSNAKSPAKSPSKSPKKSPRSASASARNSQELKEFKDRLAALKKRWQK